MSNLFLIWNETKTKKKLIQISNKESDKSFEEGKTPFALSFSPEKRKEREMRREKSRFHSRHAPLKQIGEEGSLCVRVRKREK